MLKDITNLLLGAFIATSSYLIKGWVDRSVQMSNEIFKQRIDALNEIWIKLLAVIRTYDRKMSEGHENWLKEYRETAFNELNIFRKVLEENQIILPEEIISSFQEIDWYLFSLLDMKDQAPSDYIHEVDHYCPNVELGTVRKCLIAKD